MRGSLVSRPTPRGSARSVGGYRVGTIETPGRCRAPFPRSVFRLAERDHAPADPGGRGRGVFRSFSRHFPTICSLAAAEEDEVLRLWEGLGYYRRARQLHETAKIISLEHGGEFPRDPDVVRRLPGMGAHGRAVLSIAFDRPLPILEANTERLHCRLLGYAGDPRSAEGRELLWAMAETVLPQRGAGRFNQR